MIYLKSCVHWKQSFLLLRDKDKICVYATIVKRKPHNKCDSEIIQNMLMMLLKFSTYQSRS